MKSKLLFLFLGATFTLRALNAQIDYPGTDPGKAQVKTTNRGKLTLENKDLRLVFKNSGKNINIVGFQDKRGHDQLKPGSIPLFELVLQDSTVITSNDFTFVSTPVTSDIPENHDAGSFADKLAGRKIAADLENRKLKITVHWEAVLKDGSNYVHQLFYFSSQDSLKILAVTLIKLPSVLGLQKVGTVDGSPLIRHNMFFALEYPLSKISQNKQYTISYLPRLTATISTVWGVTPVGQLRRGFLYYVERERAHPYYQILHYNSWFDISWSDRKFDENDCLDRIKWYGDSLITKRHVPMKAFLFDDGWDDNTTLWKFNSGFPDGFTNLKKAAESYHAELGVWLSPFGGYGKAKALRLEYGKKQNPPFETNARGFSLSGPVYFNRFMEVTSNFIKDYDICMFKFDGVGTGSGAGEVYQKDVEAFLKLLSGLLKLKPDLYLSLTTGTWPSVYWLKYGDNIWRGGDDTNMMGEGSNRQQWITYRDAQTYKNVVLRGPLYPLSSLMLHGICIADNGNVRTFEMNDKDISDEIWSFFATGVNLQEMYINPHKPDALTWDCLADASKWARENEMVMKDVHWIGGDPSKSEVYGFAAWTKKRAVLSLRNPSSVEKTFEVNVAKVFDLPVNEKSGYSFFNAKNDKGSVKQTAFASGKSFSITLQPFEVVVLNALPLFLKTQ